MPNGTEATIDLNSQSSADSPTPIDNVIQFKPALESGNFNSVNELGVSERKEFERRLAEVSAQASELSSLLRGVTAENHKLKDDLKEEERRVVLLGGMLNLSVTNA